MALGDIYNNNNEKKNYSPSVTSGYRFSNPESNIDKTSLSFSFWNKLLKVTIAPKKETDGDIIAYDYENAGNVYLSHTKARILKEELVKFLILFKEGKAPSNAGVSSGSDGLIYICDGKEFSADGPCLVIRKIDENGHPTSTFVYEFRRNVHTSVINYNGKGDFEANTYEFLEIEQLITLLEDYYTNMSMAVAYSIQETEKYDNSRINTKLKIIGEKLGVEFTKPGNNNNRTVNSSYFSNATPTQTTYSATPAYSTGTIDDVE